MLNMIKMDLYRMFKTKSMYVIWLVMCLLTIFTTAMTPELDRMAEEANGSIKSSEMVEEDSDSVALGIRVYIDAETGEYTVYDIVYANIQGKVIAIFIVIFTILFATADTNTGYIKNIGGQIKGRGQLVLSKAVAVFINVIITFIIFILIQAVANGIFLRYVEWGNMRGFLLYTGTEILLHVALAMICMAVAIILRNNVVSMILAVCLCANLLTILYSVAESGIQKMGAENFRIINYTVTGKISLLSKELTNKDSIYAIGLSAVFIVIMIALGRFVFEKRDI